MRTNAPYHGLTFGKLNGPLRLAAHPPQIVVRPPHLRHTRIQITCSAGNGVERVGGVSSRLFVHPGCPQNAESRFVDTLLRVTRGAEPLFWADFVILHRAAW
eukprot:6271656-Prymnesium_polylepis.1